MNVGRSCLSRCVVKVNYLCKWASNSKYRHRRMPIQSPQRNDYLNCPICDLKFGPYQRAPISLPCGHTFCYHCLYLQKTEKCPIDQTLVRLPVDEVVVNTALLQLVGIPPSKRVVRPKTMSTLSEEEGRAYDLVIRYLESLALHLQPELIAVNVTLQRLSRPLQRRIICLLHCCFTDEDALKRVLKPIRNLAERIINELIMLYQHQGQVSANLWAAVRGRGCQFLGPGVQEEVLKLILLALEDGSALSRKVLVMFVVQRLEDHFPQASKTSIGHVVQLLYRASCFMVLKRVSDSSLMQLKDEFRTYYSLRREHDSQIVQIAHESGLRIPPEQWSALLYGDASHKSQMQSIIDKLQSPRTLGSSVKELQLVLNRHGNITGIQRIMTHLPPMAALDRIEDGTEEMTWERLSLVMSSLDSLVAILHEPTPPLIPNSLPRDANEILCQINDQLANFEHEYEKQKDYDEQELNDHQDYSDQYDDPQVHVQGVGQSDEEGDEGNEGDNEEDVNNEENEDDDKDDKEDEDDEEGDDKEGNDESDDKDSDDEDSDDEDSNEEDSDVEDSDEEDSDKDVSDDENEKKDNERDHEDQCNNNQDSLDHEDHPDQNHDNEANDGQDEAPEPLVGHNNELEDVNHYIAELPDFDPLDVDDLYYDEESDENGANYDVEDGNLHEDEENQRYQMVAQQFPGAMMNQQHIMVAPYRIPMMDARLPGPFVGAYQPAWVHPNAYIQPYHHIFRNVQHEYIAPMRPVIPMANLAYPEGQNDNMDMVGPPPPIEYLYNGPNLVPAGQPFVVPYYYFENVNQEPPVMYRPGANNGNEIAQARADIPNPAAPELENNGAYNFRAMAAALPEAARFPAPAQIRRRAVLGRALPMVRMEPVFPAPMPLGGIPAQVPGLIPIQGPAPAQFPAWGQAQMVRAPGPVAAPEQVQHPAEAPGQVPPPGPDAAAQQQEGVDYEEEIAQNILYIERLLEVDYDD